MNKTINVIQDFSDIPYGRYRFDAPGCEKTSGEIFREQIILPALKDPNITTLTIDFSDESIYGRSFLSEAIGGLIRKAYVKKDDIKNKVHFIYPKDSTQVKILVELSIAESEYASEPAGYEPDPNRQYTTDL
ncbi:STAS-like domain-containing protein [Aliivibrio logei]|uniref:DUF4325 domain-containing protein n=1 Tax=Aliivibrio logei 5S-186 TaxID=626086 RepID=A0ABX3AZM8_ALILO|nr:STAS-like domain-containing protein [Aliivibrio logei]OEF17027.1 hypothetical protein A1Q5_19030 [Aliivibrio logei 5S-186]